MPGTTGLKRDPSDETQGSVAWMSLLRRRNAPDPDEIAIFYSSDLHGSDRCWKKFLAAARFYGVEKLVMGGDLTGKAIVPIERTDRGMYRALFLGEQYELGDETSLDHLTTAVRFNGMYPWIAATAEIERHREDADARDGLFANVMLESLGRWMDLAGTAADAGIEVLAIAGNDDPWMCDKVLDSAVSVTACEDRVVSMGGHELISCSYVNTTPWNSPREMNDEDLYQHLKDLAEQVQDPSTAIFMFHAPPHGSGLDIAREINAEDLSVVMRKGQPNEIPVGSMAVRQIIEEYQPLLALHGHIHESRGIVKIGKTVCVNPGSEYNTGQIHGAVIRIARDSIRAKQLVIG